jgi:alkylation response protein AidB-like acyl-CoA dehydrogenase
MKDADLGRLASDFLDGHDYQPQGRVEFRAAQFDRGLAWVHFPAGLGGLGLARSQQVVVADVFSSRGIPQSDMAVNPIGLGMAAPTLREWASEDVQQVLLRRIFTGQDIWCQMFSEPSAGSDVAGIATRAVRDGDSWVVNGQKVWTTKAHEARYGLLLARTDPGAAMHRGLSYFYLDMTTPGVEVRPLFQLTGDAEFNEVFLTGARVPGQNLLGTEGDGWRVAITTLMNERAAIGAAAGSDSADLIDAWRVRRSAIGATGAEDRGGLRDRVLRQWVESEAIRLAARRAAALAGAGAQGPEGSLAKLSQAENAQRVAELILELQGAAAMLHPDGYPMTRTEDPAGHYRSPSKRFLRSRAFTIEGGTSEVLRNMIGERILGLPPDTRVDKDVPWNQIPRS